LINVCRAPIFGQKKAVALQHNVLDDSLTMVNENKSKFNKNLKYTINLMGFSPKYRFKLFDTDKTDDLN